MANSKNTSAGDQSTQYDVGSLDAAEREELADRLLQDYLSEE